MNKRIALLLISVFVCGIGSVSLSTASTTQEKTTTVPVPALNKLPVKLKAKLPDYKGPSRFKGRRSLITFSPDGGLVAISELPIADFQLPIANCQLDCLTKVSVIE